MRTIKLRAWDPVGLNIKGEPTGRMTFGTVEYFDDMLGFRFEHFQGDTEDIVFEQFTGLLDKQGNEIYEGDVCSFLSGVVREIVWKDGALGYSSWGDFVAFGGNPHLKQIMADVEIIGNVHENPELLLGRTQ